MNNEDSTQIEQLEQQLKKIKAIEATAPVLLILGLHRHFFENGSPIHSIFNFHAVAISLTLIAIVSMFVCGFKHLKITKEIKLLKQTTA